MRDTCKTEGCNKRPKTAGLCQACYLRYYQEKKIGGECSVDGCFTGVYAKNLCGKHYARMRKHGTPDDGKGTHATLSVRFFRYVEKTDYCWIWTGKSLTGNGYGRIQVGGKGSKHAIAHRVSYEIHKGKIPGSMVVMHTCDNRLCVNPDHLVVGTLSDNTMDAVAKGRWVQGCPPVFYGTDHPNAKLNDDVVREIRASNLNHTDAAKLFCVDRKTITLIRQRKAWAHVE